MSSLYERMMAERLDRILDQIGRDNMMWDRWANAMPAGSPNAPWRGQMAKAHRKLRMVEALLKHAEDSRFESGLSDHSTFFGVPVHVPTLRRQLRAREAWHREWYDYGMALRKEKLPPR